jgi:nicotinamidase-related amidase
MESLDKFYLDPKTTLFLIIDIQEKLCKAMDQKVLAGQIQNCSLLLEAARELDVAVLATEQYPAGLGSTVPELADKIPSPPLDKMSFSCCGNQQIIDHIASLGRKSIVIAGMEAHICVLQTVIDLVRSGYHVHLLSDAVISRKKSNWRTALAMAATVGAVVTTTETVLFQLLKMAGTAEFKKLAKLVR